MNTLSSSSSASLNRPTLLNETIVQEAFHHLLQDALIQAQAESLISKQDFASHDTDVQIIASSLALYFASLNAKGNPPCIAFPNNSKTQLSKETCPASFASYFHLWQSSVPRIQRLSLEYRHDLALLLCEREPISSPIRMEVASLARDLKSVALDIVQRSTFQSQFRKDIETAISSSLNSQYIAPPRDSPPLLPQLKASPGLGVDKPLPPPALPPRKDYRALPSPPLPTIAVEPPEGEMPTLMLIRETLFAALGDCLATNQDLLGLVGRGQDNKSWSSRSYFASLCLSILDVCLFRVQLPPSPSIDRNYLDFSSVKRDFPWADAYVRTVHDSKGYNRVSLASCPGPLIKLLMVLLQIGMFVQSLSETDDLKAMNDAAGDRATNEEDLYIWRLKRRLLGNVSAQNTDEAEKAGEEHVKDAAVMINRLALAMFEIPSFRQRQTEAFSILGAVTSI